MSIDEQTIQSYDDSALEIASHFLNYTDNPNRETMDGALALVEDPKEARVIEIGCGTGRDAGYLLPRVGWYEGFDPSEKLLEIAEKEVPSASFTKADALSYPYPGNLNIVFAFASLVHLNRQDFAVTCDKVKSSLVEGGVFVMTLKEADEYTQLRQEDDYGTRLFYLYPLSLVVDLIGPDFKLVKELHTKDGPSNKAWMSLTFIKQ